jgi:hypothetical protein
MNTPVEIYEISAAKLAKSCRGDLPVARISTYEMTNNETHHESNHLRLLSLRRIGRDVRGSSGDLPVAPTFRALSPEQDSRDSNRLKNNNAIIPGRAADSRSLVFPPGIGKICRISSSNATGFLS